MCSRIGASMASKKALIGGALEPDSRCMVWLPWRSDWLVGCCR